ncbi:exported hypothetical protein [Vibrio diabolicus]|nr:exported hypothetical protein [Vibrio diabolicus]
MKKIALIIMSAIMAGMIFLTFNHDVQKEELASSPSPKNKKSECLQYITTNKQHRARYRYFTTNR